MQFATVLLPCTVGVQSLGLLIAYSCIFRIDVIIALATSLFFLITWTSVHPVQASTSICANRFPSTSLGVIGPVVSDDTASRIEYLLWSSCLKGALGAFAVAQGGHAIGV
eukprot:Plantae.Rhodophyta-Palmaria_palmata.ctg761.p3 GENE.Plantae.Rhodophyta-Palmaria_palmata.ctg761~~Plantae.Rhodophyta-Palmaria_palmata.ctg761.p3  ORF type:complete len:110 (-),score=5.71 Plantae.Rhodophyta-Palmaria_palmata.ctg761:379-708(-)